MVFFIRKLRHLDFFAIQPSFFIQSNPTIKTVTGAIISITIIIYTIFLTFFFGSELVTKKQPILNAYKDFTKNHVKILNTSNFILGIVLEADNSTLINFTEHEMFGFSIGYESVNIVNEEDKNSNPVNLIPCKREHFQDIPDVSEEMMNYMLVNGTCIDLNNNLFEGSPLYNFAYQGVRMNLKFNVTDYYEKPNDLVDGLFPIKVRLFYQSFSYELQNYHDPFKKRLGVSEFMINSNYGLSYYVLFTSGISKRDDNLFLSKVNETTIYGFDQFLQSDFYYSDADNEDIVDLLRVKINFQPFKQIYSRSYIKVQEVLAQIVSFANIGIVLGQFIIHLLVKQEILTLLYQTHYKHKRLTTRVSTFPVINEGKSPFIDSSFMPFNVSQVSHQFQDKRPSNLGIKHSIQQKGETSFHQRPTKPPRGSTGFERNSNQKKLSFNRFKKKLRNFFCFFCIRIREGFEEKKIICKYLGIEYLLNSYDELKRLENVLFNQKQLYLFRYVGKCCSSLLKEHNHLNKEKIQGCSEYFMSKTTKGSLSQIDKKLLDLMDGQEKNEFFSKRVIL